MRKVEAKDLRIGNWIIWDGTPFKVTAQFLLDFASGKITKVEPIAITEQILRDAGFENECMSNYRRKLSLFGKMYCVLTYVNVLAENEIYFEYGGQRLKHVDAVHKLQNFFHIHTEKELDVKL